MSENEVRVGVILFISWTLFTPTRMQSGDSGYSRCVTKYPLTFTAKYSSSLTRSQTPQETISLLVSGNGRVYFPTMYWQRSFGLSKTRIVAFGFLSLLISDFLE